MTGALLYLEDVLLQLVILPPGVLHHQGHHSFHVVTEPLVDNFLCLFLPIPNFFVTLIISFQPNQSCYLLPKFGSSPEFGVFQEITQKIAQKILCYFKIGQKRPKKLPNDTKTLKKLPK